MSELERVVATRFDRLVDGVEDEDIARHLTIDESAEKDNLAFV